MRVLCGWRRGRAAVDLLFEPRDLWWGAFWTLQYRVWLDDRAVVHDDGRELQVYLCLVPVLPLRVCLPWRAPRTKR